VFYTYKTNFWKRLRHSTVVIEPDFTAPGTISTARPSGRISICYGKKAVALKVTTAAALNLGTRSESG
jgi:hypothetical protein